MTILLTIVLGAVGSIIAAELLGLAPILARFLVEQAVHHLPSNQKERYLEEWLGDLDYLRVNRGTIGVIFWALGLYVTSYRLNTALQDVPPLATLQPIMPAVLPADEREYPRIVRFAPSPVFDEYLLEIASHKGFREVAIRALKHIQASPETNPAISYPDEKVYVKYIAPCSFDGLNVPSLWLAYLYIREDRIVYPLFVCEAGRDFPDEQNRFRDEAERKLGKITERAAERIIRHHEH